MKKSRPLFDLSARRAAQQAEEKSEQYLSKYLLAHFQKISNLKKELRRLPSEKEFMFLHTDKQFNAFTFIALVVEQVTVKHMYACTYSLSRKVIDALIELHDKGRIEQITLLISESMLHRVPKSMDYLQTLVANRKGIKVQFAWVHAKIALLETHDAHYVIEGSGNWSENSSVEQYLFARDADLFRFRESVFTETPIKHEY